MREDGPPTGIADFADRIEHERFIGRREVIDPVIDAARGRGSTRVFHLNGPGGVGKSSTLRAIGREASRDGLKTCFLDGRLIEPEPDALRSAFRDALRSPTPDLVVLDEGDELLSIRLELRQTILDELPADVVVVLASRTPPPALWFEDGLDRVSKAVALRPLDAQQSRMLLAKAGMADPDDLDAAVAWACGYPLALALAADLGSGSFRQVQADGGVLPAGDRLDDMLLARLGSDELTSVDPDILDVACIASAVDARLLAAALPGKATKAGLVSLRACRLSEPIGNRTTLHRLARSALATRLRESDPDRYRTLVLRIADHLRVRADLDPGRYLPELAALIENEQVRLSFDPSTTHYADRVRPGDLDTLVQSTGRSAEGWFQRLGRWMDERADQVVAVRSITGKLSAVAIVFTGTTVPTWAEEFVEVGPAIEHARRNGRLADTIFLQDVTVIEFPLEPAAASEIVRVGNAAALVRSGMPSPRFAYVTSPRSEVAPLEAIGFVELPELRRADGDRDLTTIVCDFGPAGMVGRAHDLIRLEQQEAPLGDRPSGAALVDALRCYHDDDAIAAVLQAQPDTARSLIEAALDRAFTASTEDQLLRRAIQRTYLDPDGGHGIAQRELFMSRSSFYRHLQRARSQLAEHGMPPATGTS